MLHGARGAMVPSKIERHAYYVYGIANLRTRHSVVDTFTPDRPRTKMTTRDLLKTDLLETKNILFITSC